MNSGVFLKKRPGRHRVDADYFEVRSIPDCLKPGPEQVLVETINFSVDPCLRFRMDEHDIPLEYMKAWSLTNPCVGLTGVGRVVDAGPENSLGVKPGDFVAGFRGWKWQRYQMFDCGRAQPSHSLDALKDPTIDLDLYSYGISALTAFLAVSKADCVLPAGSQTAVVSTACGSVGFITCQVLTLLGCDRVIGLAGNREKCDYLVEQLGLEAALCYKDADFSKKLATFCPKGVDIFVDLVGGRVSNTVRTLMRRNSHIISLGSISTYEGDADDDETPPEISQHLRKNKVHRHNFAVYDNISEWSSGLVQLREWLASGDLKFPITRAHGLDNTGAAFASLMHGGNIGKQIVDLL